LFVTYAQTELLWAEAISRGLTSGNAGEHYENGIEAHMKELALYGAGSEIAQADIDAYIAAHPLMAGTALEQINTQYWVASFLNGPEAFANFRRSGFPALEENPFPGSEINTPFITRLTYPDSELNVNNENISAALSRQGADRLDTQLWFAKD
jgi:hypothetical protein